MPPLLLRVRVRAWHLISIATVPPARGARAVRCAGSYLAETGSIPSRSLALTVLWIAITLGRFVGLRDQMTVESKGALYNHLYCWLVCGAIGSCVRVCVCARRALEVPWRLGKCWLRPSISRTTDMMLQLPCAQRTNSRAHNTHVPCSPLFLFSLRALLVPGPPPPKKKQGMLCLLSAPNSSWLAWTGIILYGFGNGPCVGYCYDINNRITIPSEFGMSIVMFGLNFG